MKLFQQVRLLHNIEIWINEDTEIGPMISSIFEMTHLHFDNKSSTQLSQFCVAIEILYKSLRKNPTCDGYYSYYSVITHKKDIE